MSQQTTTPKTTSSSFTFHDKHFPSMPTYLVHGFRWPREGFTGIRVHAIVHNLEDCSVEYIQNENSKQDILDSFRKIHPQLMKEIETDGRSLNFIEQYDPEDLISAHAVSQPHAFVADTVVEAGRSADSKTHLSLDVEEVITAGSGLTAKGLEALADLRDKIAHGEKIGWWMIYNGDPERAYDSEYDDDSSDEDASTPTQQATPEETPMRSHIQHEKQLDKPVVPEKDPTGARSQQNAPIAAPVIPSNTDRPGATMAIRRKPKPEPKLPEPNKESTPEPPRLKEVAQKTGFRKKFFGKKA